MQDRHVRQGLDRRHAHEGRKLEIGNAKLIPAAFEIGPEWAVHLLQKY